MSFGCKEQAPFAEKVWLECTTDVRSALDFANMKLKLQFMDLPVYLQASTMLKDFQDSIFSAADVKFHWSVAYEVVTLLWLCFMPFRAKNYRTNVFGLRKSGGRN